MIKYKNLLILFILLFYMLMILVPDAASRQSEKINPNLLENYWPAHWVAHPTASPNDYGMVHFRKEFELTELPERFIVHVSGDNRYELYINSEWVSKGPASNDLLHWSYIACKQM